MLTLNNTSKYNMYKVKIETRATQVFDCDSFNDAQSIMMSTCTYNAHQMTDDGEVEFFVTIIDDNDHVRNVRAHGDGFNMTFEQCEK